MKACIPPLLIALLAGCDSNEVSFDTLETARMTAKENAEYNAQAFRANSPVFGNFALEANGDSSQSPRCPQGDGWATVRLVNRANPNQRVHLKCSTVSASIGCLTQDDFQLKPYAVEDGACAPVAKVPFPLPRVAK